MFPVIYFKSFFFLGGGGVFEKIKSNLAARGSPLRRILVHPPKNLSKNKNCSKKSTQESEIYARIEYARIMEKIKNLRKNQELFL